MKKIEVRLKELGRLAKARIGARVELQKWLAQEAFDLFPTFTFGKRIEALSLNRAIKYTKWFFKHLNKPHDFYFEKYIKCWAFFEGKNGRVSHVHLLIRGINRNSAARVKRAYEYGIAKVYPYDPNKGANGKGATGYLADKYGRSDLIHFDFYKINSDLRHFNELDCEILLAMVRVARHQKGVLLENVTAIINEDKPKHNQLLIGQVERRLIGLGFELNELGDDEKLVLWNEALVDSLLVKHRLKDPETGQLPINLLYKDFDSWQSGLKKRINYKFFEKKRQERKVAEAKRNRKRS